MKPFKKDAIKEKILPWDDNTKLKRLTEERKKETEVKNATENTKQFTKKLVNALRNQYLRKIGNVDNIKKSQ